MSDFGTTEATTNDRVEVYESSDGQFYWRRVAANGEKIAGGLEGFTRKGGAIQAASRATGFDIADIALAEAGDDE